MKYAVKSSIAVLLLLALIGCTSNQIITSLTLAVDAAEVALPIVAGASGVDPALLAQLNNYLAAVGQALAATTDILAKNEPPAQQALDITAAFAGVVLPNLPAGLPVAIVTAVEKVSQLVAKFLASVPPPAPVVANARAAAPSKPLSQKDVEKLQSLHNRALVIASHKR